MKTIIAVAGGILLWVSLAESFAGAPRQYQFYRVVTSFLNKDTYVKDINDFGTIVGNGRFPDPEYNIGFLWINGNVLSIADMCSQGKLVMTGATGISNYGHIVGGGGAGEDACCTAVCFEGTSFAFPLIEGCSQWYDPGTPSSSGEYIAGYCYDITSYPVIHFVNDGTTINIGLFPDLDPDDAAGATAADVNNYGVLVGTVYDQSNDGKGRAFKWADGILTEIFDDLGGDALVATGINNKGHIVGFAGNEVNDDLAFIIRNGKMESLGYGEADAVNDRDIAVGNINTFDGVHAALFDNGEIVDLDEFLPRDWESSYAREINNFGWIIGYSTRFLTDVAFLLVPIYSKGDYDGDEDVDLHDFGHFQRCFAAEAYQGPEGGLHVGCSVFDFDEDVDLDGDDFAAFQAAFTGAITSGW